MEKMEFKVAGLRETLDILKPVVPKKPTLPILKNVLIRDGQAIATDLESAVALDLPEAQGACLIPFDAVANLIKYVPGNLYITVERKRGRLSLTWSEGSASYEAPDPKDYPAMPDFEPKAEGTVDGDSLVSALTSLAGYCASDKSRPAICGVTLYLGEPLELCSGDGFRMAHQVLPLTFPSEEMVIVPTGAIRLLSHLWRKAPKDAPVADSLVGIITSKRKLALTVGDSQLKANVGQATMVTQLIQGSPPDWRKLIGQEPPPIKAHVIAPDLERAVRRVRGVAEDARGAVRLAIDNGNLIVSAKGDKRQVEAKVTLVSSQGGPEKVAFNIGYLLDYLQGKEGVVTIGITGTSSVVTFQHHSSPMVLIMPMSVEW